MQLSRVHMQAHSPEANEQAGHINTILYAPFLRLWAGWHMKSYIWVVKCSVQSTSNKMTKAKGDAQVFTSQISIKATD